MNIKTLIIIGVFTLIGYTSINAQKTSQDSVYHDLLSFIFENNGLSTESFAEKNIDFAKKFRENIGIFNVLDSQDAYDFIEKPFGIYKFQYRDCMDCGYYVLVKSNDKYMIFGQSATGPILRQLVQYRKLQPGLIDDSIFIAYTEALLQDKENLIWTNDLFKIKGKLSVYSSSWSL